MAIVTPDPIQGAALLDGSQSFYTHDDAADNKTSGIYEHRSAEFSATEAESWCDFFRAARDFLALVGQWRGVAVSPPADPRSGDVYKNSGDGKLYLYDASTWQLISGYCRWRGVLASAPADPVGGDVYKNSGDTELYQYDESTWRKIT